MTGFLNGLGCLLLNSQLKIFYGAGGGLLPRPELLATGGITALTAGLSVLLPKILPGQGWPCSLLSIIASTAVAQVFNLPVATLAIENAGHEWYDGLPSFVGLTGGDSSLLSLENLQIITPFAFSIATISLLETLLAVKVVDDALEKKESSDANVVKNRSCLALAIGKATSALFGGFGGCGLIPQSILNLQSGGKGKISALVYAAIMAISVLFFAPLIGTIPRASLAGIMGVVALTTIQWCPTLEAARVASKATETDGFINHRSIDLLALVTAAVVCLKVDMGTGIILGVFIEKVFPKFLLD
jgi:SulP family sulfate permease